MHRNDSQFDLSHSRPIGLRSFVNCVTSCFSNAGQALLLAGLRETRECGRLFRSEERLVVGKSLRAVGAMLAILLVGVGCEQPKPVADGGGTGATKGATDKSTGGTGAESTPTASAPGKKTKVALLLNWYPEAEHGGFYAAKVHGVYEKYGLDVDIQPGGKTTVVAQSLALGRVQFGVANADDVLVARNQDVPMVALMAPIQIGPRCIMVRKDSGITTFEQLKNITLQIDSGRPYVSFMKSKGLLDDSVKIAPYFGSVAQLVAGPGYAAQGYTFSEPFMAQQQGVEVTQLMMSDLGYNPYASLLVSMEPYTKENAEVCRKMVLASIEGWQRYLLEPKETNAVILAANKQGLTKEALDYGVEALKPLCYVNQMSQDIGVMSPERWTQLADTLVELKLIDRAKLKLDASYTLGFLPKPESESK